MPYTIILDSYILMNYYTLELIFDKRLLYIEHYKLFTLINQKSLSFSSSTRSLLIFEGSVGLA